MKKQAVEGEEMEAVNGLSVGGDGKEREMGIEEQLVSAREALWAIANMQIKEETDKGQVLDLCMSIAKLELLKVV